MSIEVTGFGTNYTGCGALEWLWQDGPMDFTAGTAGKATFDGFNEASSEALSELFHVLDGQSSDQEALAFDPRLRSRMLSAAEHLADSELDGDRMLARRLFLVAGFVWPALGQSPSAAFAVPMRKLITAGDDRGELFASLWALVDALPEPRDSLGAFANSKLRMDAWVDRLVRVARTLPQLDQNAVEDFAVQAKAVREMDLMTRSGSVFAEQLREANNANAEAARASKSVRELAVTEADSKLSSHFAMAARKDGVVGGALAASAIAALGGSFGFGYNLLGDLEHITWSAELAKLALTLPLLAVSVYVGRLSSHYRDAARWAKSASIQLNTIDAFIQGIENNEARDEMRLQLGRRVFGDPGLGGDAKNPDTQDATALIDALANAAKNVRGQ